MPCLLQEQQPKLDLSTLDWGCTSKCSVTNYVVIIERSLFFFLLRTARSTAAPVHFRPPNLWGTFNGFFHSFHWSTGTLGPEMTRD